MIANQPQPRFSGHETFVCRYAWLPKVVKAVSSPGGSELLRDETEAMVRLGIGKNMVRSAKFWAESAQIIEETADGTSITPFGQQILGHDGYDEFLERPETLWLIHWKIATNPKRPLFHWEQMLNHWHRPEFCESEVLPFLRRGMPPEQAKRSKRTLSDGFRVFVNSYCPSKGKKGEIAEDNLDCPLVELGLLRVAGERLSREGNRETIYSFDVEPKPSVSAELLAYCINDFWNNSHHNTSQSLGFGLVSSEAGSPGQIFKLPEAEIRSRLDFLSEATDGALAFEESHSMQQVWRRRSVSSAALLHAIYQDF